MTVQTDNRIILLVEDSDDDAFFFERALANTNVPSSLIRVSDGGAAVDYLSGITVEKKDLSQTHLMFLDLKLPVLSGFEVLKWIQEHGISIEVIILSGSDLESDIDAGRRLGAADYLVKPISADQLRNRLTGAAPSYSARP